MSTEDDAHRALVNLIVSDAAIMRDLEQKPMAFALHDVILATRKWAVSFGEWKVDFTPRYAASLVAEVRGKGENYLDYYGRLPDGMSDNHLAVMRAHLTRIGIVDTDPE